jgi:hypothetical protein
MELPCPQSSPLPTPTMDLSNHDRDQAELEKHKMFMLKPKHNALVDLMLEWVGVGYGGIEGRNNKFGARWRKQITCYIYSRTELTIKGI